MLPGSPCIDERGPSLTSTPGFAKHGKYGGGIEIRPNQLIFIALVPEKEDGMQVH